LNKFNASIHDDISFSFETPYEGLCLSYNYLDTPIYKIPAFCLRNNIRIKLMSDEDGLRSHSLGSQITSGYVPEPWNRDDSFEMFHYRVLMSEKLDIGGYIESTPSGYIVVHKPTLFPNPKGDLRTYKFKENGEFEDSIAVINVKDESIKHRIKVPEAKSEEDLAKRSKNPPGWLSNTDKTYKVMVHTESYAGEVRQISYEVNPGIGKTFYMSQPTKEHLL